MHLQKMSYVEHFARNLQAAITCACYGAKGFLWHLAHAVIPSELTSHDWWNSLEAPSKK